MSSLLKVSRPANLNTERVVIWGNPYFRLLRGQLEQYIIDELGLEYLINVKRETELNQIKKEITSLKKKLKELEVRKKLLESQS